MQTNRLAHGMVFLKILTNCFSMIFCFKNVARKNTFLKILKNRKCLYIRHLRFLRYQIFTKNLVFERALRGC